MQNANIFRAAEYSKDDPSLKSADHYATILLGYREP